MDDDEFVNYVQPIHPTSSLSNNTENGLEPSNQSSGIHPLFFLLLNSALTNTEPSKDISTSIEYLKQVKDPDKIIEDELAISALIDINEIYRKNRDKIGIIIEAKFQIILKDLFQFIYETMSKYIESEQFDIQLENTSPKFTTFHLICDLTEILVITSKDFASLFHMIGGTKCFLAYFSNKKLASYLIKSFTNSDPFRKERKMNYCRALASILNALLYIKTNRSQSFKEMNTIETLSQFSNSLNFESCELILRCHFILATLCTRKQIQQLENIDFTVLILEKTIQMFAQASQKKTKYNSYQFDLFYDNEMRSFEITTENAPNTFIIIVLSVTEAFLVSDEIKYRVFGTIKNSLIILLSQGDLIEKYLALSLLFNLSFDQVLNEKISKNSNVLILIEQLLTQAEQLDESVFSLALCLKSLLNVKKLLSEYESRLGLVTSRLSTGRSLNLELGLNEEKKVLLSFHEHNELISMRIRLELEQRGFCAQLIQRKQNIDKEIDIQSVIRSIESCGCLVICLSSYFEFEKLCKFETYYACKLGKKIIPVSVQCKYVPDYWLEGIVEDKRIIPISLSAIKNDIGVLCKEIMLNTNIRPRQPKSNYSRSLDSNRSKTCLIL